MTSESTTSPEGEGPVSGIIAAYLEAVDRGEFPDRQALLQRYPEHAEELKAFFADRIKTLPPPSAGSPEGTPVSVQDQLPLSGEGGRSFGGYEILEELGRGGMGVVYKARQVRPRRRVALKLILDADLCSPAELQRFRREAEVVAQLEHPHIVPVYEAGVHEGHPYLSMKLIEGGNLEQALAGGRWPVGGKEGQRQVAALLIKVARAVHYAHRRGILHRDLKPANILLDEHGEPHVTDFGLARRLGGGTCLTRTGTVMGTPSYMAPEQAAGLKEVAAAADVFSLGAVLYELLTGRPPFRGGSALETLLQVQEGEPTRPRTLNPRIGRDLEAVCLKCLEKGPARRYASAEALAEDLDRWLREEPVEARRIRRAGRLVKWVRRKPVVAALLGLCLLAGLGTAAGFLWQWRGEVQARSKRALLAEKERERAENEQQFHRFQGYLELVRAAARELEANHVERAREILNSCPRELRALEWYCLNGLCKGPVSAVPVSAESKDPLTDPRLRPGLTANGENREPPDPWDEVLSPDGKRRYSKGVISDTSSGRTLFRTHGYNRVSDYQFVGFTKDGQRFVDCEGDRVIIKGLPNGQDIVILPGVRVGKVSPTNRLAPICFVDGKSLTWYSYGWLRTIDLTPPPD
jgi:tRNA A-37 threonylcarbamoyl transferase component Bud32